LDPRSGIRDGEKSEYGIQDKHPGSATLAKSYKKVETNLQIVVSFKAAESGSVYNIRIRIQKSQ